MLWNWQLSGWPEFFWDARRLAKAEALFLTNSGVLRGSVRHMADDDKASLTIEAMSTEALTTSEIEGEILDRAGVQSSIRRQLGFGDDRRRVGEAENGIAEMMVGLYRSYAEPLSDDMLFGWHRMLTSGRRDLRDIGCYRRHEDPMQVVSGPIHAPNIHFEAPPSDRMAEEMIRFIDWFNRTAPGGQEALPAITRAALAHLYFVSIHPFEDGNGRIARAIAEKALSQALAQPSLTALAATILIRRKGYYDCLERNNKALEVTDWLAWFAATVIEAQRRTIAHVDFIIDKTKLLDRLQGQLNERQEKALSRMLREGPEGFKGGLSASNYTRMTGAATATTTRDLVDLVDKGALTREGERRHARYYLAVPIRPVEPFEIDG